VRRSSEESMGENLIKMYRVRDDDQLCYKPLSS